MYWLDTIQIDNTAWDVYWTPDQELEFKDPFLPDGSTPAPLRHHWTIYFMFWLLTVGTAHL